MREVDTSGTPANRELRRLMAVLAEADALARRWLAEHGLDVCACPFCRHTPEDQTGWVVEQLTGIMWAVGHARASLDSVAVETPDEWAAVTADADPPTAVVGGNPGA